MKAFQPTIGSYDPEKALEVLRKKSPRVIIAKIHESKKTADVATTDSKEIQPQTPDKFEFFM